MLYLCRCSAESDVEVTEDMALIKDAILILEALYRGPRREAPIDINVAQFGLSAGAIQNLRSLKGRSSAAPRSKGVIAKNSRRYAPRGMHGDASLVQPGGPTAIPGSQIQPTPEVNNGSAGEDDPHLAEIEQLLAEGAMQGLPPPPLHQAATPLPGRASDAVMLNDIDWRCDPDMSMCVLCFRMLLCLSLRLQVSVLQFPCIENFSKIPC